MSRKERRDREGKTSAIYREAIDSFAADNTHTSLITQKLKLH